MRKQQQPPASEPEKFERWTAQRKVAIILEVLKGQISVPEASRRYGFTQGEYRKWADEFMRGGVGALKVNREILAQRIKHLIDDESYLGYRMV